MKKINILITIVFVMIFAVIGCSNPEADNNQININDNENVEGNVDIELIGAGASFPYPLYAKMFEQYNQLFGTRVNYNSIGSGGGINQLIEKTVDFGATDAPMKEEDMSRAGSDIIHIPTCLGAVVVSYNLPDNPTLKLTSDIIADIFLGKITKWNDERIVKANPDIDLLDMDIVVVHRSDGSGTTYIFSDYLTKVSSDWSNIVGRGKSLDWPVGLGANGNTGVAGQIKAIPGSIGYTELIYALSNDMPTALIKNKSGNFIEPSIESVSVSADVPLPEDMRVSITDTEAGNGYPISGFTWIILYKEQNYNSRNRGKAEEVVKLVWWMTHEGQSVTEPLHYAPLPEKAVKQAETLLKSITFNNENIL